MVPVAILLLRCLIEAAGRGQEGCWVGCLGRFLCCYMLLVTIVFIVAVTNSDYWTPRGN